MGRWDNRGRRWQEVEGGPPAAKSVPWVCVGVGVVAGTYSRNPQNAHRISALSATRRGSGIWESRLGVVSIAGRIKSPYCKGDRYLHATDRSAILTKASQGAAAEQSEQSDIKDKDAAFLAGGWVGGLGLAPVLLSVSGFFKYLLTENGNHPISLGDCEYTGIRTCLLGVEDIKQVLPNPPEY